MIFPGNLVGQIVGHMPPDLKYKAQIEALKLNDCPNKCVPKERDAYRFCFDDIHHADTWVTQAEKAKRNGGLRMTDETRLCDSFGLSFFTSEVNAKATWQSYTKRIKDRLGYKKIMQGKILEEDGVCSTPGHSGHFNLFEYEGRDLNSRFLVVSDLK